MTEKEMKNPDGIRKPCNCFAHIPHQPEHLYAKEPCQDCKAKQATIDRLRMNLAMMLGGDDAETLDRVEIQLSMGDLIYPPAHAGLSAIEALRETKP
jgi:hypothetical protein